MKIEPQDAINRVFPAEPAPAPLHRSEQDCVVQPVAKTCQPELQAEAKQVRRGMGRKPHKPAIRAFEGEMEDVIDQIPRDSPNPWPPSK
jgi:hypothetical protein